MRGVRNSIALPESRPGLRRLLARNCPIFATSLRSVRRSAAVVENGELDVHQVRGHVVSDRV